ncbi:MAG: DUF2868 domain-containing protein [Pseudomonadota bacterium]
MAETRPNHHLALADWLLADTMRRAELQAGIVVLDAAATRSAVQLQGAQVADRIVARARRKDHDGQLQQAIDHALNGLRWTLGFLLVLGGLAGAGAAQAVLGTDGLVRLSWALLTLLGVPTLLLVLWLVLWLWPRRGAHTSSGRGWPGRLLWWLSAVFARRLSMHPNQRALAASLADYGRHHGRRLTSMATHAFWAAFFIGAMAMLWAAFIGLRFDFSWGTTIIATDVLERVVLGFGWLPSQLSGLALPTDAQILALLTEQSLPADRGTWAWYLIAALGCYGLLPRALLALGFGWRQRQSRPTLDLSASGFLQLLPVLSVSGTESLGEQGRAAPSLRALTESQPPAAAGTGEAVMIGVELEQTGWPIVLDEDDHQTVQHDDSALPQPLGRADHRQARQQLLEVVALLDPKPTRIVALCSLLRSPDRGIGAWLASLNSLAPVELVLIERAAFAARGGDLDRRAQDWHDLAERQGLRVLEPPLGGPS